MPDTTDATTEPGGADLSTPAARAVVGALRAAGCVFAEDEARLLIAAAAGPDDLAAMVARRAGGLPLEQVVGWAGFGDVRVLVDPGVFVPRRRTEFLVVCAAALTREGAVVVDLCCGTGAIGAALAAARPGIDVHAADLDPAAVACARRNLAAAGGTVHEGDLFDPLPADLRGRVEVLTANVPYVPSGEIAFLPPEARDHEALMALDGGPDGLDVLRRVAAGAPGWLAPGGCLLCETGEEQAPLALEILRGAGLDARAESDEDRGATVVLGTRPRGA